MLENQLTRIWLWSVLKYSTQRSWVILYHDLYTTSLPFRGCIVFFHVTKFISELTKTRLPYKYKMKRARDDKDVIAYFNKRQAAEGDWYRSMRSRRRTGPYRQPVPPIPLSAGPRTTIATRAVQQYARKDTEIKIVDGYFESTPAIVALGVMPNPIDCYFKIAGVNAARNVWPSIAQGTARDQRVGTKINYKYIDGFWALNTNTEGQGDIWRISLVYIKRNNGSNGASYGGQVYGSAGNAGGIGNGSAMPNIFWPRNEDYMSDFTVLREWDVDTMAKNEAITQTSNGEDTVEGRYIENIWYQRVHVNLPQGLVGQWQATNTSGDITASMEGAFCLFARNAGRPQGENNEHRFYGSIRVGFTDY